MHGDFVCCRENHTKALAKRNLNPLLFTDATFTRDFVFEKFKALVKENVPLKQGICY